MSDTTRTEDDVRVSTAGPSDFIALLKPRVMSLVIFTALVGMVVAPAGTNPLLMAISLLAIAVGAGASGALNMWYDADIDRVMSRTAKRPIPSGRVSADEALAFGTFLSCAAVITLGLAANLLAAGLLAFTIFFYVFIYTMWLKRRTPQNIVIGGAAGAFPPMIGWSAVTGDVGLFLIIFMWTPPHFWALALLKSDDYARAGVPMLPVVAGERATRTQILIYSIILIPIGVAPAIIGFGGLGYAVVSSVLGAIFLALAARIAFLKDQTKIRRTAGQLFAFSILYLTALFGTLLVERLMHVG
jgi:protoheme IX farnesyltransferase